MLNTKVSKWFGLWFLSMIILAIIFQPKSRPDKMDEVSFNTQESDELYFNNVRLFYYSTKNEGNGIFQVYRLRSVFDKENSVIPFAIYHNWRANEAFIRIDTSFIDLKQTTSVIKDSAGTVTVLSGFPDRDNISQFNFSRQIFRELREYNKIGILHEGKEHWFSESSSKSMRQTLKDYFKLIGKL